jgi:hypothetical protein
MQMPSEGMKRLSLVLGVVQSVARIISIAVLSNGFAHVKPLGWFIFFLGIPVSFGIMFLVVWGVDWVIAGFRAGAKH